MIAAFRALGTAAGNPDLLTAPTRSITLPARLPERPKELTGSRWPSVARPLGLDDAGSRVLRQYDLLITPTTPTARLHARPDVRAGVAGQPVASAIDAMIVTYAITMVACRRSQVPAGFAANGCPSACRSSEAPRRGAGAAGCRRVRGAGTLGRSPAASWLRPIPPGMPARVRSRMAESVAPGFIVGGIAPLSSDRHLDHPTAQRPAAKISRTTSWIIVGKVGSGFAPPAVISRVVGARNAIGRNTNPLLHTRGSVVGRSFNAGCPGAEAVERFRMTLDVMCHRPPLTFGCRDGTARHDSKDRT